MDINILATGSTGNCYQVSDGETSLLLDAGIPIKAIRKGCRFTLSQVKGCLITHAHGDHANAANDLLKHAIDVYTSQGTIDACGLHGHRVHAVKSLNRFTIDTFDIIPFDVIHDAPEPLGFMAASTKTGERLLYFTDTCYIKYRFCGLTHILGECNYDGALLKENVLKGMLPLALAARILKNHMSLESFLTMLNANDLYGVCQIYMLHMSETNGNEEKFKFEVQKLTGAEVYVC